MTNKVLAGPILRRTTKNRVCVWLATSESMQLRLTISDGNNNTLGTGGMDETDLKGIQLGERLFVHLLQARSEMPRGYPIDTLLYYRIDKIINGSFSSLFSDEETREIVYGTLPHPSFFIPSKLKNLLHGSCRKPHGKCASADALSHGHTLIQETWEDLDNRPAILLLTGDQIYADDVAISLSAKLREQAIHLAGQAERMPEIGYPGNIPLHGRKQILKRNAAGLSSQKSENHLFSFGEYAAMYLYTFGNLSGWEPVWDRSQLRKLGIAEGEEDDATKALFEQTRYLRSFHSTLPDIRRLLANIPTYMMFDDHDVTDDWNITLNWYDRVRGSKLGRRIVSNALAACWAFQAWGNDPDNYHKDMVGSIKRRLADEENKAAIAERYDLHTWKHRGWGFSVPTVPPIIAIDSRTQRQYDNHNLPAQLMDRYALDWLRMEWAKLLADNESYKGNDMPKETWPVIVAATPVLGFAPIETFVEIALRLSKIFVNKYLAFLPGVEGCIDRKLVNIMDIESWAANKKGYKAFFDVLQDRMKLPGSMFLSGDVHYAFSAKGEFACNREIFTCMQLTSSAMNNMPNELNQEILGKLGGGIPKGKHGVRFALGERKRWSTTSSLLRPEETDMPIQAECNIGLVQFDDGRPSKHTLLTGSGKRTYELSLRKSGRA